MLDFVLLGGIVEEVVGLFVGATLVGTYYNTAWCLPRDKTADLLRVSLCCVLLEPAAGLQRLLCVSLLVLELTFLPHHAC